MIYNTEIIINFIDDFLKIKIKKIVMSKIKNTRIGLVKINWTTILEFTVN